MATTEPIIIPIEGDASDFVQDSAKVNAELDKMANGTRQASGANTGMAQSAKSASLSITDLRSAYQIAADVARVAGQVWQETGGKFVQYADEVRNVSRTLGASAEESSRLIQVADDVGISYEQLAQSMKMAQKDGVDPSIQGLAKLADEYTKLKPGIERTQFLLDKFGKSGAEMGKLLEKGSAAILDMNAGISDNLVLTQEALDNAREYQISVDNLSDAWDGFTYKVAPPLVDALTTVVDAFSFWFTVLEKVQNGMNFTEASQFAYDQIEAAKAAGVATEAFQGEADSMGELVDGTKNAAAALKAISDRNKEMLDFTMSYADFQRDYVKEHADAVAAVADAQQKLNDAIKNSGVGSKEALDARDSLKKAQDAVTELETTWHEKTQRMIYDMILTKLSADGLTTAEYNAALQVGQTMGIFTEAEVKQAQAMMAVVDATVQGIQHQEELRVKTKNSTDQMMALARAAQTAAGYAKQMADLSSMAGRSSGANRDSGGPGVAGQPYLIGRGAQPEMFIPSTNGTFVPNADKKGFGNVTYNITINNPKAETAENSIRKSLKKLSYIGVAA